MVSEKYNSNMFLLLLLSVLVVAFTDSIFNSLPVLKKLFNDQVNYILVIALVILITLLDMPCGIILAFLVLYLSVYMNKNKSMGKSMGGSMSGSMGSMSSMSINNNVVPKVRFSDTATIINNSSSQSSSQASIASDSEFVYNNTKPFPNNNLMPFQPVNQETINMSKPMLGCSGNTVNTNTTNTNDYMTQVGLPNRDGFDVTGCRYDFKNSPQNLTKYGPPLAQCGTYSGEQSRNCGTVFYPLNA